MEHTGCVNLCSLTSTLPVIPYQKLTDLHYLSKGGFGTVFKAQHSDWRTTVAIKCLKLDSPVGERYVKHVKHYMSCSLHLNSSLLVITFITLC